MVDPKASLRHASECILAEDHAGALEHLKNYRQWRRKGGFEPVVQDHEFTCSVPIPEGGAQGDALARQLGAEAQHVRVGTTAYGE